MFQLFSASFPLATFDPSYTRSAVKIRADQCNCKLSRKESGEGRRARVKRVFTCAAGRTSINRKKSPLLNVVNYRLPFDHFPYRPLESAPPFLLTQINVDTSVTWPAFSILFRLPAKHEIKGIFVSHDSRRVDR